MKIEELRVLVVDDDPLMRTYIQSALRQLGISKIELCESGDAALRVVTGSRPDLILTDIHMQPLNGLEFVKKLRAMPNAQLQRTKVIFMSADSSQQTLREAVPLGIAGYIVKPPKAEQIKARIDKVLETL